jgi:predicted RNase H-like HicB family nuclease
MGDALVMDVQQRMPAATFGTPSHLLQLVSRWKINFFSTFVALGEGGVGHSNRWQNDGISPAVLVRYTGSWRCCMKYKISLHKSDEGYSVSVPGLPGCWSQGDTETEALDNIKDAIREYLAAVDDNLKDADVREVEVAL